MGLFSFHYSSINFTTWPVCSRDIFIFISCILFFLSCCIYGLFWFANQSPMFTKEDKNWNNNPYLWNNVYEITVTTSERGGMFYDKDRKKKFKKFKDEEKYIKLLCIINDKTFEEKKYINKKLKISSFDEEFTIKEIKKVDVAKESVEYKMNDIINLDEQKIVLNPIKKEIKITIKNVEKHDLVY